MRPLSLLLLACLAFADDEPTDGNWIVVEMTAYCPCKICTDGLGITTDGTKVREYPYGLAGDRLHFKLGQQVWIPGGQGVLDRLFPEDRMFTIEDRGQALDRERRRKGIPRIDLRVKEHWWAKRFGRKLIVVVIGPSWR